MNAKYKSKYRSLIFNLRDANNPDLRRRVLSREIPGAALHYVRSILPFHIIITYNHSRCCHC